MSRITTVHDGAQLTPTKLELITPWLRRQPWFHGVVGDLSVVGNFKFEDERGKVGLDSLLIASRGEVYYVPVTWRSTPLPGWAELIGELDHSELGRRYCYNAASDSVFVKELTRVIREGDTQSEVHLASGGVRQPKVRVQGNGVKADGRLRLVRQLGHFFPGEAKLVATWEHDGVRREDVLATIG